MLFELFKEVQSFDFNDGPEGCDEIIDFLCRASGLHHMDVLLFLFVVFVRVFDVCVCFFLVVFVDCCCVGCFVFFELCFLFCLGCVCLFCLRCVCLVCFV